MVKVIPGSFKIYIKTPWGEGDTTNQSINQSINQPIHASINIAGGLEPIG